MKPTSAVSVSSQNARTSSVAGLVTRVRGWLGRPLGRGVLVLCGLVVLSLVGRFAVAGGRVPPATPEVAPLAIASASTSPSASASPPAPVALGAVASPFPSSSEPAAPVPHSARATPDDPVYLNEATVDQLQRLPGIGAKRALAVLELRKRLGRFKQIEDLLRVRGIGRATLRKLRPLVRLDHPSADGGAP